MNILSLDIATKTGYAHSCGKSGVWDFTRVRNESECMPLIKLRAKLSAMHFVHPFELLVFEQAHFAYANSARVLIELQTVAKLWADEKCVHYSGTITPSQIKMHATGKGNAKKPAMLSAASAKWPGVKLIDDNHADALWLLDYAKTLYGSN